MAVDIFQKFEVSMTHKQLVAEAGTTQDHGIPMKKMASLRPLTEK